MSFRATLRSKKLNLAALVGAIAWLSACGSSDSTPAAGDTGGATSLGGAAGTTNAGGAGGTTSVGGAGGTTNAGGAGGAGGTTSAGGTGGVSAGGGGAGGAGGTPAGGAAGTGGAGGAAGTPLPDSGAGGAGGTSGAGGSSGTTDGGVSTGTFTARRWFASENSPLDNVTPAATSPWNTGPQSLTYKLDEQSQVPITAPGGTATTKIDVDPATTYQSMLGFGISMEEASVANINKLSSPAKKTDFLKGIVDPVSGMGQNLFRITMGTSDFTGQPWYSYDDGAPDPNMDRFSIQKDIDAGIIGVLKEMLAINPDVKFFGSVWSPPGWMKDSGTMLGGNLVSANIPALAKYFRKFVEAYTAQNIPIYAVTLQNEPQHSQAQYPTCVISAAQEVELVKAVKAEFTAGNIATKIWVFDHNFDIGVAYSTTILSDAAAAAATDGVAWHDYGGLPSEMSTLHAAYPNKDIFFTEKTLWGVAGVERAAQYIRNWSRSYVSWLTMLDQGGKPNNGPNTGKVRRFVKATTYTGAEYWPTAEHYLFGLYSKFVKRDAKRISSTTGTTATVTSVAFLNTDKSIATVVINQTATTQQFVLASEGNQIWSQLPAKTAATYVWTAGLGKATAAAVAPTN
jgi:glucosylceramidase